MKEVAIWFACGLEFSYRADKNYSPKIERVRRDTFEHSHAFNVGMVQELENMQREYLTASDPKSKSALASIIRHRASGYDLSDPLVTPELRDFIKDLK